MFTLGVIKVHTYDKKSNSYKSLLKRFTLCTNPPNIYIESFITEAVWPSLPSGISPECSTSSHK
jgi:hypothetical protein